MAHPYLIFLPVFLPNLRGRKMLGFPSLLPAPCFRSYNLPRGNSGGGDV